MDAKSLHCKHPKKIKSSKDKHEVFVLPPDLLKKLGISIGNINGSQETPVLENASPSTAIINNEHIESIPASNCTREPSDTSILETASLMKKSVFLSPSFVSTVANVLTGEIEISSKDISKDTVAVIEREESQDSVYIPRDSNEVAKLLCNSSDIQEGHHNVDQYNINLIGGHTSLPNINKGHQCMSHDGNKKQPVNNDMTFDEYLIKLDSKVNNELDNDHSLKRDNNVEFVISSIDEDSACVSLNDDSNNIPVPKTSKINIISEETIPLSKLREIKRAQCLNGKKLIPVTVQSIIDTKINIENRNSELHSIKEPNSTVILENTEILHSDLVEVNSGENTNQNNLKSMNSNEHIEATPVPIEDTRTDVIANNIFEIGNFSEEERNLKDFSNNSILSCVSAGKDFNEDSTNNAIGDYKLNDQNKISEDDLSSNVGTAIGLNRDKSVVTIDVDKNISISNGQMDDGTEPAIDCIKNISFGEKQHKRIEDKAESSTVQEVTAMDEHSTVKDNIKPKSNTKQNSNSINALEYDNGLKRLTEHKISSKNVEDKLLKHDELASILSSSKKLSSSINDIKVDKVKEIAAYLRKFSHIYTDKKKMKKALSNDITKMEKIKSKKNKVESKLCIQGVEKPGGNEVDRKHTGECKVLKTYARRQRPKASALSTYILQKNETWKTVDALDLDLKTGNISTTCEVQEFCLCYDFGRLAYYDCDNLYEHIHFWHHHAANCELDLIFAIYNDEAVVSNSESGLEQEEKIEEKIEAYSVCWNIFQSEFSENVDKPGTKLIGHHYAIDELKDICSVDSLQVPVLSNAAQKVDERIMSEISDEVQMKNNSYSDIILETIDHEMVDTAESINSDSISNVEKPLNTDINDNNSAAGSGHKNTGLSSMKPILSPTSVSESKEISSLLNKTSIEDCDAEEQTYQHRQSLGSDNKVSSKEVRLDSGKTIEKTATKRSLSEKSSPSIEPSSKKSVKCALCNNIFSGVDWEHHVENQHNLIAWRTGGSINLYDPELLHKLKERLKTLGVLECSLCSMQIRKFNRFMEHIKYCIRKKLTDTDKKPDKPARKSRTAIDENVTCAVCQRTMLSSKWLEHIGSTHDYLAWKQGQGALDLHDESAVWHHLQNIIRLHGSLTCYKCGLERSRVKTYQSHIKTCDGTRVSLDDSSISVDLNSSNIPEVKTVEPVEATTVKCGVCEQDVAHCDWIDHISKEHNYLAWQEGETPLDLEEEEAVWNHLQQFIRQNGGLTCHKCGLVRKRVKLYLTHIEMCDGTNSQIDNSSHNVSLNTTAQSTDEWFEVPIETEERKIVKCGVCSEEVPILEWIQHMGKEHDYLAWQHGATPLDLGNECAVKLHLLEVSRMSGGLVCNKCEKRIKYPKTYQQHTKECTGPIAQPEIKIENLTTSWIETLSNKNIKDEVLTCGVCAVKVESEKWINHIETQHQYLAWVEGQPPLNLEDPAMVQRHLNDVSKILGGLICIKCGVKRKYVKSYLVHVDSCQMTGKVISSEVSFALMSKDVVECAICAATMEVKDWRNHAMKEHYNIAWVVGDNPIEINNPYAVESYLKEYVNANHKLVCKVCKISRVSYVGFYAHIIVCGKTEKETEIYKSVCDICNNKYLRIYKSQHMTMHREKEYAMERKLLAAKEQAQKKEDEPVEVLIQSGRRKAAEKAKNVIEKYKKNLHNGSYHCSKCGFNSETEKELADHVCVDDKWGDATDSDESVKLENCSTDESDETDIDSNVSDEEQEAREQATVKKKKHSDSSAAKICRLPYQISNVSTYMKRTTEEFIATYLTDEDLFPLWHHCEIEEIPDDEVVNYMPPIEESCKVRFVENQDWFTFKRLESNRVKDTIVLFMGANIQCMSWAPPAADVQRSTSEAQFLAVVSHRDADAPRHAWDETPSERSLIQIWDCGNLIATTPKFVLGIALDFGTIWAIDWCPSGARDVFDFVPAPGNTHRLGLMAAACSNGVAYIFVVPYPTSIKEREKPFYKLIPVVELRLTSNENRRAYQATAIKWSVQKGHSHVVVGYADGSIAYYDLNVDSPILRTTENNRTVIYPYHDERVQNSTIEDVDMYPSGEGSGARAGGAVCVGSVSGAGAGLLQSHVAAAKVLYPPHWPAALLAGDDCLVKQSINELEWWGGGRRLGGARAAAGCAWCGRLCAAAPPLLRLLRPHPAFPDMHKQVIGRIMMIPFGGKRKRQNDELAMIVEPITYNDAVKKYGIEFKQITARDRTTQQKLSATPRDAYPERFPLSDVADMQFCPTFKQHHKLAIAIHAGLIFIINV